LQVFLFYLFMLRLGRATNALDVSNKSLYTDVLKTPVLCKRCFEFDFCLSVLPSTISKNYWSVDLYQWMVQLGPSDDYDDDCNDHNGEMMNWDQLGHYWQYWTICYVMYRRKLEPLEATYAVGESPSLSHEKWVWLGSPRWQALGLYPLRYSDSPMCIHVQCAKGCVVKSH
jgi:hypothetical protein